MLRGTSEKYGLTEIACLRIAHLSTNVLICLFGGVVRAVGLHLQPESLHFGLDPTGNDHKGFLKKLKSLWKEHRPDSVARSGEKR